MIISALSKMGGSLHQALTYTKDSRKEILFNLSPKSAPATSLSQGSGRRKSIHQQPAESVGGLLALVGLERALSVGFIAGASGS